MSLFVAVSDMKKSGLSPRKMGWYTLDDFQVTLVTTGSTKGVFVWQTTERRDVWLQFFARMQIFVFSITVSLVFRFQTNIEVCYWLEKLNFESFSLLSSQREYFSALHFLVREPKLHAWFLSFHLFFVDGDLDESIKRSASDWLGNLVPQVRARTSPGVFRDMALLGLCLELSFSVLYCRTRIALRGGRPRVTRAIFL